ncbi:MAG: hypothetical protein K6E51_11270 [Treponema sp.]|nr:hypothetical protein [Treponema sp.]
MESSLTKEDVRSFMEGTLLSDTRIVTATVRTHNPELTVAVADALEKAFYEFGEETREVDAIHTWQKPEQASLVVRDVRLFRACMVGLVFFDFVTLLVMLCKAVLDDSIYVPATFEKRYHIPMVGRANTAEYAELKKKYIPNQSIEVLVDEDLDAQVHKITTAESIMLVVKAGNRNGKQIERCIELCSKLGKEVAAAKLVDEDERLLKAYYRLP